MALRVLKSNFLILLLLGIICLGTVFFLKGNDTYSARERLLLRIDHNIHFTKQKLAIEGQACRVPELPLNSSEIMTLLEKDKKIICNGSRDWVEMNGSTAKISSWAKEKYGKIKCSFTDIIRESDAVQYHGMTTTTHTEYNLEASDVVIAFCTAGEATWQKVLVGIRSDQDIFDRASWAKVPDDSLKLNVLMFGFDSLSHNMWKRKLPKTYNYAVNDLKGLVLNGYNIVGDGTAQALIPILTGRTELGIYFELPDVRKNLVGVHTDFVNVYPFIWNDFLLNGYVTGFAEDMPHIGTFQYRLRGFKNQPVDHYMMTFYKEVQPFFNKDQSFCYGSLPLIEIMLSYVKNMYEVHKDRPKFLFAFSVEYSHDYLNVVSGADNGILRWLQDFNRKGYLNDTLLILMSDHGSRFQEVRATMQGKQEERLPGFIFIFPSWFAKKYPEAYKNFKKNTNRLTTPFDIYETLKNVLHFEGAGMGDLQRRGISLFKEIPLTRDCSDAGIEPHWCTCLEWEIVPNDSEAVTTAVKYFLTTLNGYTSKHRSLCSELQLGQIFWSAKLLPNRHVLAYKKNLDIDGFMGDMSDKTAISVEIYQVKVSCNPGNMLFEASIRYYPQENRFSVVESEISRINEYRKMTHCIEDRDILHHLRKYCYCV